MPRVSVILCSYNQKQYLPAAIASVLAQTYEDWELIVIDNGSTDGSRELLRSYEQPNVRLLLNSDNAPISRRFNEGIVAARGELVSFLYSDDWYLPRKLAVQVEEMDRRGSDYGVVYGLADGFNETTGARWTYPSYGVTGQVLPLMLRDWGKLDMLSPMARKECFVRYPFHDDMFAEGEASFVKLAMRYKFAFVRERVVVLRDHGANRGKAIRKNVEMVLVCLDRLARHPDFPEEHREALVETRRATLRRAAWTELRLGGDTTWARECYRRALALSWREAFQPRTLVGMGLSFVPADTRQRINRFGHWLRKSKGNQRLVDGYGGASE